MCNLKFIVVTSHCSSKIYFDMEKFYNNCHYIYQCLPVDVLQDFTFQYFLFNTLFNRVSYSIFTGSFAFYLSCHGEEFYSNADCFPCCSFFSNSTLVGLVKLSFVFQCLLIDLSCPVQCYIMDSYNSKHLKIFTEE